MTNTKVWLTRHEVCARLGISIRTLNRARRAGKISAAVGPFGTDILGREVDDPDLALNAVSYHRDEVARYELDNLKGARP
jgi:predicted site-specific integrase-resolvase